VSFDKPTRNRLARFVTEARKLIAQEFTEQFQSLYGISSRGDVTPLEKLGHLDDEGIATASLLRERIDYLIKTHPDDDGTKTASERLARELAFTVLNRMAALRMAESRGLIVESVGKGYQSKGFKVFETVAGSALGDSYQRYCRYLYCLFDELSIDLGVLFDRRSPQGLLFPREPALLALSELINAADLDPLWAEDETIGWIYQYYNDEAERKKMREESAAPRNSRELAVRNQFFTPRYVVEFLTDNTLGRIWYEMTQGQTRLKDQCRYMVRRPSEIFLKEGEIAPETPSQEGLGQNEILKQPVYITHRPMKDPREIRLLDPACGSMHFGLYAFDLYEAIYSEAWELEEKLGSEAFSRDEGMKSLHETYTDKDALLRDIPRLVIECNIHGIDIDPRATQIAGLSLWLRAQRAWHDQGVKAVDRPRITRGNIVCAETMPGSPEMLQEFTESLKLPVLRELVKSVFEKMELAGEAGSLLKIDEEIRSSIEEAKKAWEKIQGRPRELFSAEELNKVSDQPELTALEKSLTTGKKLTRDFWESAEEQVLEALKRYAEQADSESVQKRLFADDAAKGFAFIDLCRKSYDAVVMNPPFGSFSKQWSAQSREAYPNSYNDILGAFVERFLSKLNPLGRIGAITSRTCFFLTSFKEWRLNVVLQQSAIRVIADFGQGVMDNAMVEAAAYVFEKSPSSERAIFIRALVENKRQETLFQSIDQLRTGILGGNTHYPAISQFQILTDGPFVYWSSPKALGSLAAWPTLKESAGDVRQGLATADDPRFARAIWEAPYENRRFKANGKAWTPYIKSGASQPWFSPITLLVNWGGEAAELWNNLNSQGKVRSNIWMLREAIERFFFKPGFSWTRRAVRFIPYVVPEGCIPSASRYVAYPNSENTFSLMGLSASNIASVFLRFYGEKFHFPNYMVETVKLLPWPSPPHFLAEKIKLRISTEVSMRRRAYQNHEPFHEFTLPLKIWSEGTRPDALNFDFSTLLGRELESDVANTYGLTMPDLDSVSIDLKEALFCRTSNDEDDDEKEAKDFVIDVSEAAQNEALISYLLGICFGRWDIRYATGDQAVPKLPNPFAPLTICSPGMLQNAEGLPTEPKDVPAQYPLPISWSGILVDDDNHPSDIVARIRESMEVIWKDGAEHIEQESCDNLGMKSLRDYFRRPSGFFADHLSRYSKSRRQAPIYWPLSTKSGSYTLWLYYHRLTDQTLHSCLADFLDLKIRKVQLEIDALRESGRNTTRVAELQEFLDELKDLHDEIEEIIKIPWKPNLNDGVLITAAPLWKLFRLPKWQKDLKACWQKMEKGDYDWAHLALSIWPDRVKKVCEKDRSIAIAHGLEHLCKVEPPKAKGTRKKKTVEAD